MRKSFIILLNVGLIVSLTACDLFGTDESTRESSNSSQESSLIGQPVGGALGGAAGDKDSIQKQPSDHGSAISSQRSGLESAACLHCRDLQSTLDALIDAQKQDYDAALRQLTVEYPFQISELEQKSQEHQDQTDALTKLASEAQLAVTNNQDPSLSSSLQLDAYNKAQNALAAQKSLKVMLEEMAKVQEMLQEEIEQFKKDAEAKYADYQKQIDQLRNQLQDCLDECGESASTTAVSVPSFEPLPILPLQQQFKELVAESSQELIEINNDQLKLQLELGQLPANGEYPTQIDFKRSNGSRWFDDQFKITVDWSAFEDNDAKGDISILQLSSGQMAFGKIKLDGNFYLDQGKEKDYTEVYSGKFKLLDNTQTFLFEGEYGHSALNGNFDLGTFEFEIQDSESNVFVPQEKSPVEAPSFKPGVKVKMGF